MKTLPAILAAPLPGVGGVRAYEKHEHAEGAGQFGHARQYTCPMKEHSDVVLDKPGNCSKCGMKLVEKE